MIYDLKIQNLYPNLEFKKNKLLKSKNVIILIK